jgi:hypothetical protein
MKRRKFISGLATGVMIATPIFANDYVSTIVRQLEEQGFRSITQSRTLLGRVRINAIRDDGTREIIVNPSNGEILRDLWSPIDGSGRETSIVDEGDGGGKGDDDDDDDGDDDDDDDNGDDDDDDDSGGDDDEDDDDEDDDDEDDG